MVVVQCYTQAYFTVVSNSPLAGYFHTGGLQRMLDWEDDYTSTISVFKNLAWFMPPLKACLWIFKGQKQNKMAIFLLTFKTLRSEKAFCHIQSKDCYISLLKVHCISANAFAFRRWNELCLTKIWRWHKWYL